MSSTFWAALIGGFVGAAARDAYCYWKYAPKRKWRK